jgi:hypothetical protein
MVYVHEQESGIHGLCEAFGAPILKISRTSPRALDNHCSNSHVEGLLLSPDWRLHHSKEKAHEPFWHVMNVRHAEPQDKFFCM